MGREIVYQCLSKCPTKRKAGTASRRKLSGSRASLALPTHQITCPLHPPWRTGWGWRERVLVTALHPCPRTSPQLYGLCPSRTASPASLMRKCLGASAFPPRSFLDTFPLRFGHPPPMTASGKHPWRGESSFQHIPAVVPTCSVCSALSAVLFPSSHHFP